MTNITSHKRDKSKSRCKAVALNSSMTSITISSIGDVLISLNHMGEKPPTRFLVSSTILCTASPVFSAMLGPSSSFSEAASLRHSQSTGHPYIQNLSDDDPVALTVILNAIHLQTSKVPRQVTFQQLMKLAILCDKYDCVPAVKMWADLWMSPLKPKPKDLTGVVSDEWLFISWVFEAVEEFGMLTKMYVWRVALSDGTDGNKYAVWTTQMSPASWHPPQSFSPYTPDAILDAIIKQRETVVRAIIDICKVTFSKYSSGRLQCRHPSKDDRCDSLVLGSLYKVFTKIGILPFDCGAVDSLSLERLIQDFKGIKINHLDYESWQQFVGNKRVEHSKTCDPLTQMLYEITAQLKKVVPLSLESFKGKTKGKGAEEGTSWEVWEKKVGVSVS